jgi:hypothetical protein
MLIYTIINSLTSKLMLGNVGIIGLYIMENDSIRGTFCWSRRFDIDY